MLFFRKNKWESVCNRCGLCCYEKKFFCGLIYIDTDAPCVYLDADSNLCKVYPDRFSKCSNCKKVTIFTALFSPYLPAECAYVLKFRPWKRLVKPPVVSKSLER